MSLYEEIYDAVKAISPQTIVFCVFSREIVEELREADLRVLNMFSSDKLDMLVLTTYPIAVKHDLDGQLRERPINRPSHIPTDYYKRVTERMPGKPLGFSEVGWPSENGFGGEDDQADFIIRSSGELTVGQGIDLRLYGWPWLHNLIAPDRENPEAFPDVHVEGSVGLINYDGTAKAAYEVWKDL